MKPIAIAVVLCLLTTVANAQQECLKIVDDSERLACFDIANGVRQKPKSEAVGKWIKSVDQSALTDDKNVFISLTSENELGGQFGGSGPGRILLRCMENVTAAFFDFNEHFMSDIQQYGRIEYRLDKDPMKKVNAHASTDNRALGLWSGKTAIPFIKDLFGHQTLVVRATPFNESAMTLTFDISGIENVIGDLRETCRW